MSDLLNYVVFTKLRLTDVTPRIGQRTFGAELVRPFPGAVIWSVKDVDDDGYATVTWVPQHFTTKEPDLKQWADAG